MWPRLYTSHHERGCDRARSRFQAGGRVRHVGQVVWLHSALDGLTGEFDSG